MVEPVIGITEDQLINDHSISPFFHLIQGYNHYKCLGSDEEFVYHSDGIRIFLIILWNHLPESLQMSQTASGPAHPVAHPVALVFLGAHGAVGSVGSVGGGDLFPEQGHLFAQPQQQGILLSGAEAAEPGGFSWEHWMIDGFMDDPLMNG